MTVKEQVNSVFDSYFIFESSKDCYHVINPVIRSLVATKRKMELIECQDDKHTDIGVEKNEWTLRVTEKGHKQRPELISYAFRVKASKIYSKPHLEYIDEFHDVNLHLDHYNLVGDTVKLKKYATRVNNH